MILWSDLQTDFAQFYHNIKLCLWQRNFTLLLLQNQAFGGRTHSSASPTIIFLGLKGKIFLRELCGHSLSAIVRKVARAMTRRRHLSSHYWHQNNKYPERSLEFAIVFIHFAHKCIELINGLSSFEPSSDKIKKTDIFPIDRLGIVDALTMINVLFRYCVFTVGPAVLYSQWMSLKVGQIRWLEYTFFLACSAGVISERYARLIGSMPPSWIVAG